MEDKKQAEGNKKPAEEVKQEVILMNNKFLEVMSQYLHREGTNDYTKEKLIIEEVRDKSGQKVNPIWEKDWKEAACGIETRMDSSDRQYVRIYRKACPVRIKFQKYHEYGTYDGYGNSCVDSYCYWVQYKAERILKKAFYLIVAVLFIAFIIFIHGQHQRWLLRERLNKVKQAGIVYYKFDYRFGEGNAIILTHGKDKDLISVKMIKVL